MALQSGSKDDDNDMITEINVTPFVDVVLVLLILFMLAAPAVYQSGLKVQLPQAATATKFKHVTLQFMISADGQVVLGREKLSTAASVTEIVKRALALDPMADAMVSADRAVAHGRVLETIDAIKQAGIKEIALGAETKSATGKGV